MLLLEEQLLEDIKQDEIDAERNKGPHLYRESKTSIDDGTFAVFNRFRDKTQLPLQKMVGKTIAWMKEMAVKEELKKIVTDTTVNYTVSIIDFEDTNTIRRFIGKKGLRVNLITVYLSLKYGGVIICSLAQNSSENTVLIAFNNQTTEEYKLYIINDICDILKKINNTYEYIHDSDDIDEDIKMYLFNKIYIEITANSPTPIRTPTPAPQIVWKVPDPDELKDMVSVLATDIGNNRPCSMNVVDSCHRYESISSPNNSSGISNVFTQFGSGISGFNVFSNSDSSGSCSGYDGYGGDMVCFTASPANVDSASRSGSGISTSCGVSSGCGISGNEGGESPILW